MISDKDIMRFMDKVRAFAPGECWEWVGAKNRKGYGQIRHRGVLEIAHRFSYEMARGEFDKQFFVCHSCDNPSCVNPDHLFLGSNQDNVDDKMKKKRHWVFTKTHCPQGHEYAGENLYVKPNGSRVCRICQRTNWRNRYRQGLVVRRKKEVVLHDRFNSNDRV
jgi:hypothetical protein